MRLIEREQYLDRVKALKDTPDIKIITGFRRSGKSNLMQAYIEYLKNNYEDVNIIFVDFMDLEYEEIKLRNIMLYTNILKTDMRIKSRIMCWWMKSSYVHN